MVSPELGLQRNTGYNFPDTVFNENPLQSASSIAEVLYKMFTSTAEDIGTSSVENAALSLVLNGYKNTIPKFHFQMVETIKVFNVIKSLKNLLAGMKYLWIL